jgi:hypothetical protein
MRAIPLSTQLSLHNYLLTYKKKNCSNESFKHFMYPQKIHGPHNFGTIPLNVFIYELHFSQTLLFAVIMDYSGQEYPEDGSSMLF